MIQKITWKVISWKQLWRTIGFPTANVEIPFANKTNIENNQILIEAWTYKVNIFFWNKIFHWVWAYLENSMVFEVHIFDFSSDIYGETLEIYLLEKIRNNKKFDSLDDLKRQISVDMNYAKNNKSVVLTFWTFDIFHDWHKNFLLQAKKYSDTLVTIIATDKNVEKIKLQPPKYNQYDRKNEVEKSNIPDEVYIWSEDNPMIWIEKFNPNFICLWYDQIWFASKLDNYIKDFWLKTKIIRMESFKPDIYKSSILKKNKK